MTLNNKRYKIARIISIIISLMIDIIIAIIFYFKIDSITYSTFFVIPILVLLPLGLYRFFIRKYSKRKKILSQEFPKPWLDILNNDVKYYTMLNDTDQKKFRDYVQVFLGEKLITGIKTDIDDKIRILIASSAIIPVFSFEDWEYDNLSEILVYPSNFTKEYDFTQKNANILGMVGIGDSMIISKPALLEGFRIPNDRNNVGIHEFAHKVDGKDGIVDGIPSSLMTKKMQKTWVKIMKNEMNKILNGKSDINPYATTNEAEFFAVTSEYFFENPEKMKREHSSLYCILRKIYKQDTNVIFKSIIKSMISNGPKKITAKVPCFCGSGNKISDCCLKED